MYGTGGGQKTGLKRLEDEIKELREPIEKTIMDVRELLAEIDNAVITSPDFQRTRPALRKPIQEKAEMNSEKADRMERSANPYFQRQESVATNSDGETSASAYLDLNLYAVTSFILRLLGYQNLERILQSVGVGVESFDFLKRRVREVGEIILRGSRLEGVSDKYPIPGSDAYLLGFYLLSLFLQRPRDPNIGLLVITLSRILLGESLIR